MLTTNKTHDIITMFCVENFSLKSRRAETSDRHHSSHYKTLYHQKMLKLLFSVFRSYIMLLELFKILGNSLVYFLEEILIRRLSPPPGLCIIYEAAASSQLVQLRIKTRNKRLI